MGEFNQCVVNIPVPSDFDHCPLDITMEEGLLGKPKPFKYQAFWLSMTSFIVSLKRYGVRNMKEMGWMCCISSLSGQLMLRMSIEN
ncbi:hypothetical protein LIER_14375 [Lithospermum erythrorhizon]|uniref:Uncharacterized protein n=1 Tax=Lithospermum erythrorhizon TaxID=34254 RepID=A0AAV3Q484_LITER